MFDIPSDSVVIEASIVDSVDTSGERMLPEKTEGFSFDDIDDMNRLSDEIYKRRMLNALVTGASLLSMDVIGRYVREIFEIDPELPSLYKRLIDYNNVLIYMAKDTMEDKDDVEKPVMQRDYHSRILDYLNTHQDHPAIRKIYQLEPLTTEDVKELEKICWKELGTKEEYETYIKKGDLLCGDKVAVFIRSIIGINRVKAREMFSKFLSDNVLNSMQEEYLNQIIGYVVENGDITPDVLMRDSTLKELRWSEVFGQNLSYIGRYIKEIHELTA